MEPRRRFRFFKELSEGAFGKVYLAEMITGDHFKSVVAIKLLHGKWADHEEIVQRSRDEARVLGLLHHRNIIRVEDLTSINGQCAIVMEYLDGVDLKNLINHAAERETPIPRRVVFDIGAQIASALEAAYSHQPLQGGAPLNLIHRDIKPSNVMLTRAGDVKVLDFGTAQARFDHREAHTQALAFGSAAYMAPERLAGDPDAPSGDTFSLGITLYELLALSSFGKIHLRPEKFDAKLDQRLAALPLETLEPDTAAQLRTTLRAMLHYDAEERPTHSESVELLENLVDIARDGSTRRYCREVVAPLRDHLEPDQDPNDRLTGSTLYEDRSSFSALHASEPETAESPPVPEPSLEAAVAAEGASPTWIGADNEPAPQVPPAPALPGSPEPDPDQPLLDIIDEESEEVTLHSMEQTPGDGFEDEFDDVAPTRISAPPPSAQQPQTAADPVRQQETDVPADPGFVPAVDNAPPPARLLEDEEETTFSSGPEPLPPPQLHEGALPPPRFLGPGTLDTAVLGDPAAVGAAPVAPPSVPAAGADLDLFTAPTIHRAPLDDDDPFGEYEDDPVPGSPATPAEPPLPQAAAPAPSDMPETPQPRSLRTALLVAGGVLLVGVAAAGFVLRSTSSPPPATGTDPQPGAETALTPTAPAVPGGTVEVGPVDAEHGNLRLSVPAGTRMVEIVSSTSEAAYRWSGTEPLTLAGLESGLWRTKVQPAEGRTVRATLEVSPDTTCFFTFVDEDWAAEGCE